MDGLKREMVEIHSGDERWRPLCIFALIIVVISSLSNQGIFQPFHYQGEDFFKTSDVPFHLAPLVFQPIKINLANEELLTTISGIGPRLASRIVSFRKSHGPFRKDEDLLQVRGIGDKTLQKIKVNISYSTIP